MSSQASPKLRQIVMEAVFRRKRIVLTTLVAVCGTVLLACIVMHRKYQANAKLLVQNVRSASQLSTSSVDHLVSQGDVSPTEINTEVDLLESDGVARRALGYTGNGAISLEAQDTAIRNFEHQFTVEAVHQTNVVNLKVLANSPAEAKRNLQRIIDSYFEERAGTARNSGAASFFDAQLDEKTRQLNKDQDALTKFQVEHGIADLEDQTKLQVVRIGSLTDQISQAEAALEAQRRKSSTNKQELVRTPDRSQTQQRTTTNQYSQERLSTALVDLENRRSELLKRYVPSDRQIIEVDEKISTTRKAVSTAAANPAVEALTDVNPVWQQLNGLVATSGGEISGLEGQRAALRSQLTEAKARLADLEQSAAAYGELRRKVQLSQADYTLYAQRRDEARISEALDRQKLFDVAVLQAPVASTEPVRPQPVLYMITALAFAVLLGTLLAVYADLAGGQVHTPAQLDMLTGTRTLATFANEIYGPWAAASNRLQYRRVLLAIRQALTYKVRDEQTGEATSAEMLSLSEAGMSELGSCVAFTSALAREGIRFLSANLATEAARQMSSRVAVLDMQVLLSRFEAEGTISFAMRLDEKTEHWVLNAGESESPAQNLSRRAGTQGNFSARLRPLLQQARYEFDLLILACPSLQASTLAIELAPCVDGYVAVVGADASRKHNIEELTSQLGNTQAPLLGYVLNRRTYPLPRWLHRIL